MTIRWRYVWFGIVSALGVMYGLSLLHTIVINDEPWSAFSRAFVGMGALFVVEGSYQNTLRARKLSKLVDEAMVEINKGREIINRNKAVAEAFLATVDRKS